MYDEAISAMSPTLSFMLVIGDMATQVYTQVQLMLLYCFSFQFNTIIFWKLSGFVILMMSSAVLVEWSELLNQAIKNI